MSHKRNSKKDKQIVYRRATQKDLNDIISFVDKWLSGRATKEGGGNDYFVTKAQHKAYLKGSIIILAIINDKIVGWGVKYINNALIHLLVSAEHRGKGIGGELLRQLNPDIIRSKTDQSTGNPAEFYEKHGYFACKCSKVGRKNNIELFMKKCK